MWRSFLYQAFRNVAETTAKINKQIANESFASEEERNRRIDELWKEYGASGDGGVVTSAMPSKKNPKVLDPRTITENDVREMLEMAQYGVLDDDTYIPMRSSTPQFFIDVVREHSDGNIEVMQVPMAAQVEHVRQNMEEDDGSSYGNKRPHNLSTDDVIKIAEEMGNPAYIVLQKNGRYAIVVSFFNNKNKQIIAVVDFAKSDNAPKNYKYIQYMNGYEDGYYNIIVTQYEPDDLIKYLNDNEVVYDKKKMNGKYQVGSGRIVAFTHDTPFISDIISETDDPVNSSGIKNSLSSTKNTSSVDSEGVSKNPTANKNVNFSMSKPVEQTITQSDIQTLRSIGRKSVNDFTDENIKKAEPFARRAWNELGFKSPFFRAWFGDVRANDKNTPVNVVKTKSDTRGLHHNTDTGWQINRSAKLNFERHNSVASVAGRQFIPYIDGIIENSILLDSQISDNDNENSIMFHSLYAVVKDGSQKSVIKLVVEELKNPGKDIERRAYKLVDIEKLSTQGGKGSLSLTYSLSVDSIHSIADLFTFVKTYDKKFNPKPSSKVVDDNGMPLIMYHGTNSDKDFYVFDTYGSNFGLFGIGAYFTDNKEVAESYTKKGKGNNPRVYEVYLSIKNPLDMDAKADKQLWIDAVDEQDKADFSRYTESSLTNEDMFKALKELCADNEMYREEAIEYITSVIQKMGYDGITHIGGGRYGSDNGIRHRVYIAFEPEQIKSATDNIGTFNKYNGNIKLSISSPRGVDAESSVSSSELDRKNRKVEKLEEKNAKISPRLADESSRLTFVSRISADSL